MPTEWGQITGTLSNQTDLETFLGNKLAASALDPDPALTANSDAKVATQKAIAEFALTLFRTGEFLLNPGGTTIDLKTDNPAQDVYTVPAGKTLILTRAIWYGSIPDPFSNGDTATLDVITSDGGAIIIQCSALPGSQEGCYLPAVATDGSQVITAGNKVQARPDKAYSAGPGFQTAQVIVFGYLF